VFTLNEMLAYLWNRGKRQDAATCDMAVVLAALQQDDDGTAPWVLPLDGYFLARRQTCQERAVTLALLRQERARVQHQGLRVEMLGASWN
jgi:hypothetical protein